jgi:hypothetical protein
MQRRQAFKFELRPTGEQQRHMRRFAGSCRFVFNKALALQKDRYEHGEKKLGYAGLCKLLTEWRNSTETIWLADVPVHPLQQKLKDLERAYSNFFAKRADFPRFKKKGRSAHFRYPDPKQFTLDQPNSRVFLPKLGWLRYRNSRDVLGTAKNITVSCAGGKWYASIRLFRHPSLRHLHTMLEDAGHIIVEAGSGQEALHAWNETHPDLVITDHSMPGMSGVELIRALGQWQPGVKGILMSAGQDPRLAGSPTTPLRGRSSKSPSPSRGYGRSSIHFSWLSRRNQTSPSVEASSERLRPRRLRSSPVPVSTASPTRRSMGCTRPWRTQTFCRMHNSVSLCGSRAVSHG